MSDFPQRPVTSRRTRPTGIAGRPLSRSSRASSPPPSPAGSLAGTTTTGPATPWSAPWLSWQFETLPTTHFRIRSAVNTERRAFFFFYYYYYYLLKCPQHFFFYFLLLEQIHFSCVLIVTHTSHDTLRPAHCDIQSGYTFCVGFVSFQYLLLAYLLNFSH